MDIGGTDSASCGTSGNPCKTMQYILDGNTTGHPSGAISAGDRILVNPGTYSSASQGLSGNDQIDVNDTTNHLNITITASDTGNPPLFQGDNTDKMRIYIYANVTGVEISHIKWRASTNGYGGGIWGPIRVSGKEATIDNCELYNCGSAGIAVYDTRGVTISNNTIHDVGLDSDRSADAHGIAVWGTDGTGSDWSASEVFHILNNTIYNCNGDGFQDVTSGYTRYVDIEGNTIYNCGENCLDFKYSQYVKIHENTFYGAGWRTMYTGTHTGSNNAPVLTDSAASFVVDDLIGLVVRNYKDDSYGTITDNDETTVTATLGSGSENDWDTGDFYLIGTEQQMAQYALINIGEGTATYSYFYIWNNILHSTPAGAIDPQGTVEYWWIWNNIIYNNCRYPRWNGGAVQIDGGTNMTVVHNTIYNCAENANGATTRQTSGLFAPGAASNIIKNNIFWNNGDDGVNDYGNIQAGGSADIDYNYVYPTSPGQTGTNAVTDADPKFVNAGVDFHLESDSPCIGTATPLADSGIFTPTLDKDGVTRDGSTPDIGAYEYIASVTATARALLLAAN